MSFCGATDTLVFDFWWRLLWGSKPEWAALFALGRGFVMYVPCNSALVQQLLTSWRPAWQPSRSHPRTCEQFVVSLLDWYIVGAGRPRGRNSCRTWTGRGFTGTFIDGAGGAEPRTMVARRGGGRTTHHARGRGRLLSTHGHSAKRHVPTDLWLHYSYSQVSHMPFSLNSLGPIHTKRQWKREPKRRKRKQ